MDLIAMLGDLTNEYNELWQQDNLLLINNADIFALNQLAIKLEARVKAAESDILTLQSMQDSALTSPISFLKQFISANEMNFPVRQNVDSIHSLVAPNLKSLPASSHQQQSVTNSGSFTSLEELMKLPTHHFNKYIRKHGKVAVMPHQPGQQKINPHFVYSPQLLLDGMADNTSIDSNKTHDGWKGGLVSQESSHIAEPSYVNIDKIDPFIIDHNYISTTAYSSAISTTSSSTPIANTNSLAAPGPRMTTRNCKYDIEPLIINQPQEPVFKPRPTHWTEQEHAKLIKLLDFYPEEEVQANRFKKISKHFDTRDAKQVASRVQKYFAKLNKLKLPIPGSISNNHNNSTIDRKGPTPPTADSHILVISSTESKESAITKINQDAKDRFIDMDYLVSSDNYNYLDSNFIPKFKDF